MTEPVVGPPGAAADGARAHATHHARALAGVLTIGGVGVLATAAFQLVVIRGLGPTGYGLLASFLALINVASVASAALRNSVAVAAAKATTLDETPTGRRRLDGSTVEALVLGGLCMVGVLVASPLVGGEEGVAPAALVFAVLAVGPYFLFARAQGLLQGASRTGVVVLWSTGTQVLQLGLSVAVMALGWGAVGVLGAILVTSLVGTVGSAIQARRLQLVTRTRPFTPETVVVLALTIAFTWTVSVDVVLVQMEVDGALAGAYAAAATVVKTMLIVPATLSLYLLPRFVHRRRDAAMTRLGVLVTLGITLVAGGVMVGLVAVAGDFIAGVFGSGYDRTADILPVLALAWIPWAMAQGLLIRLTAVSSRAGVVAVVVLALCQWFGGRAVLPSVSGFITFNGVLGVVVLAAFVGIHLALSRDVGPDPEASADYARPPRASASPPDDDRTAREEGTS